MTLPTYNISSGRTLSRDQFLVLLQASQNQGAVRFARRAALVWLAAYPGDLPVNLIYARLLAQAGQAEQALEVLNRLCQADPEYSSAVEAKLQVEIQLGRQPATAQAKTVPASVSETVGWLMALDKSPDSMPAEVANSTFPTVKALISWSRHLAKARRQLGRGEAVNAEQSLHSILASDLRTPLVAATHLRAIHAQVQQGAAPVESLRTLATHYQQRWPGCLVFRLLLAEALMQSGGAEQAVGLLHTAAAEDITGQVAERLWGIQHPYQSLWPEALSVDFDLPVPAEVAAQLGWNQLPGAVTPPPTRLQGAQAGARQAKSAFALPDLELDETIRSVQEELKQMGARLQRPELGQADARYPIYVLLTTQAGLLARFGPAGAATLENSLQELVSAIQGRRDWGATLFYADAGHALGSPSLQVEQPGRRYTDAWALKLALHDLDEKLRQTGERIGAVLIVGGPAIVPFHHLPNPVDDADDDVPSDNPYGTLDENYFIPEWPVGRLPEGDGDPESALQYLCQNLAALSERYRQAPHRPQNTWWARLWSWLYGWLGRNGHAHTGYGYTAAAWRQSSLAVFRPIGEAGSLHTSPPLGQTGTAPGMRPVAPLPDGTLAYFNLHGLVDAVEWYGQREMSPAEEPASLAAVDQNDSTYDYPIAVAPGDILGAGQIPSVIFTEACYGAHINGRRVDQALALTFLQAGAQAMVGSTCTAYGSIRPPLIAADLLGFAFWEHLQQGLPAGEALRRARISLASEMHNRQGYLDGEDQKTLISFVLYGDPLAYPLSAAARPQPVRRLAKNPLELKTVCDRAHNTAENEPLPAETLYYVKRVVQQYLPGMQDADLTVSREHRACLPGQPGCPSAASAKQAWAGRATRRVVTLSKQVTQANHDHQHYARLTLDEQGKLVKLAVSR